MAFKVLTEEALKNLNEREMKLYNEEYELYKERCAFVDRLEELEKVKYPEIKPNYMYLKKINIGKVRDKINIDSSKVILKDAFFTGLLKRSDSVEKIDLLTEALNQVYIAEVSNVIISKTREGKYNMPEDNKVILPRINTEGINEGKEYNFEKVHIQEIPNVLIKQNFYVSEIEDEEINLKNMINIDTSYPDVQFNVEDISDNSIGLTEKINLKNMINIDTSCPKIQFNVEDISDNSIDLIIDNNYKMPTIVRVEKSDVSIAELDTFIPDNYLVDIELSDSVEITKQEVRVAEAQEFVLDSISDNNLDKVDATVINAPRVNIDEIEENVVEVTTSSVISAPSINGIEFDKNEIIFDKSIVVEPAAKEQIVLNEDIQYEKVDVDTMVSVAPFVDFISPEIVVNKNKITVESPINIESDTEEILRQIISSMGEDNEE